jgi:hypothetical protein
MLGVGAPTETLGARNILIVKRTHRIEEHGKQVSFTQIILARPQSVVRFCRDSAGPVA